MRVCCLTWLRRCGVDLLIWCGFVGLAYAVYGVALEAPFIWDDWVIIYDNPILKGEVPVWQAFFSSVFGNKGAFLGFYRPFQVLSYFIDVQIFGGIHAYGMRCMSVFLHSLTGFGLFLTFRSLRFSTLMSVVLGILYTVHPLCIEGVTYLSGRGDGLLSLLFVWAMFFWMRGLRSGRYIWFGIVSVFYSIALLVKENGVLMPLVFLSMTYCECVRHQENDREKSTQSFFFYSYGIAVCLMVLGLMYGGWVLLRVSGQDMQTYSWLSVLPWWQRLATIPLSLLMYLKLTFFPVDLHMEYHFFAHYFWQVFLAVVFLSALVFFVFKCLSFHRFCLWFSIILMGWLPVNGVFPRLASTIREHWWMIPLVGIMGILGEWFSFFLSRFHVFWMRFLSGGIVLCVVMILMGLTLDRNQDWRNPIAFYKHDIALEPRGFLLYNNLGVLLHAKGKYESAGRLFAESIRRSPGQRYSVAYNNYGVVLERFGYLDEAIGYYRESYRLTQYFLAKQNLDRLGYTLTGEE